MTPTNRDELVALMAQAADVADDKAETMIDAMIKAGLAVVPNAISYALIDAAIGPSHDIDGDRLIIRRVRGQEGHNALNQVSRRIAAAIAAGRIDGGAA